MFDTSIQRRLFIKRCAASAFGLALPNFAQQPGAAEPLSGGAGFGKAKNVIFIMVGGGLSHIDTFDPKSGDVKGPGDSIRNNADGEFTSYLPQIAKVADKMCVIRSMTAKIGTHQEAQYFMRTAFKENNTIVHPMLGAWAQRLLGRSHDILPSSVTINRGSDSGNGFLPASMSPLPILDPDAGLQHVKPKGNIHELEDRLAKLNKLDRAFREDHPDRNIRDYSDFYDDSLKLMKGEDGVAFDLTKESPKMRDAYGRTKLGQGCLLARRLVESGVRFVEVHTKGWDFHKNLEPGLDELTPALDQAYSQLIRDLNQRGLLKDTLVVLATEFGRSPSYKNGGRNHYPAAFSTVLAGGGVKGGYIHGATDERGGKVMKDPVTVGDLHSTIGWAMGISPEAKIVSPSGRPFVVGDRTAKPVRSIFA